MTKSYFYLLIVCGIPFLQLGISFYLSVQILLFIGIVVLLVKSTPMKSMLFPFLFTCLVFLSKYLLDSSLLSITDFLLTSREFICCLIIIFSCSSLFSSIHYLTAFNKFIVYFLIVSLCLVSVQFLAIKSGLYVGFPIDWFIANSGTLEGFNQALYYGTRIRPTGFFGEPSYMSFVTVSLMFTYIIINRNVNKIWGESKSEKKVIFLAFVIVILLQSMSGIIIFICAMMLTNYRNLRSYWLLMLLIPLLGYFSSDVASRLSELLSGVEDESTNIRVMIPWLIISNSIFTEGHYFGVSIEQISHWVNYFDISSIDNAFFYLLLHYGFFGLIIISGLFLWLYKKVSMVFSLMFILIMNFNGAIFSYDKVVIISIMIISIRMAKNISQLEEGADL